jgi:hypothetical protein
MISEMELVFIILVITTICFLLPRFRSDLVALSSLLALYLTGLLTVPEALSGFSNNVVIMIAALFIVGEGVFQTGLAQKTGNLLVKWTGNSEFKMMVFMMLVVAVLSGFISNTGTVAILLPVVCQQHGWGINVNWNSSKPYCQAKLNCQWLWSLIFFCFYSCGPDNSFNRHSLSMVYWAKMVK